jgi:hypothetical protein
LAIVRKQGRRLADPNKETPMGLSQVELSKRCNPFLKAVNMPGYVNNMIFIGRILDNSSPPIKNNGLL